MQLQKNFSLFASDFGAGATGALTTQREREAPVLSAVDTGIMASKGAGKVRGLTRPGSNIVPAGNGAPAAPAASTRDEPKRGDALVGCSVRRTANGHDESEHGSITLYIAASNTYRVGSLAVCGRAKCGCSVGDLACAQGQ